MTDITVIGGGPAGSAAAIRLARGGANVRLYEKKRFPRPKLCGGFISGECLPELEALDVLESVQKHAFPVTQVALSAPSGRRAQAPLAQPGISISREELDAILLQQAREAGVDVREGEAADARAISPWTVSAAGRSAPGGRGELRYGFQAYFDGVSEIADHVALDLLPGGYIGWVRQAGRVNLCGLVDQAMMRQHGPDLDHLLAVLAKMNPLLRQRLSNASRQSVWLATGPVVMGRRTLAKDTTLFVGDAACVVDPFAGQGITMALRSGHLAAEALLRDAATAAARYAASWEETFARPLLWQSLLRQLTHYPWGQEMLTAIASWHPVLLKSLTLRTRPA